MRVASLHLRAAPGLAHEIRLEDLGEGLVLLVGPNASGKSTIGRCIAAMLWPQGPTLAEAPPGLDAVALLRVGDEGAARRVTLVHGRVSYEDGRPSDAPTEAAGAWRLSMAELLQAAGATDANIARSLERELLGGHDLRAPRKLFAARVTPPAEIRRRLDEARRAYQEALGAADDLARREESLARMREALDRARAAFDEKARLARALDLARAREALRDAETALAALPPAVAGIRGDEFERYEALGRELESAGREAEDATRELGRLREALEGLRLAGPAPSSEEIDARLRRADAWSHAGARGRELRASRAALLRREETLRLPSGETPRQPSSGSCVEELERALPRRDVAALTVEAWERLDARLPPPSPHPPLESLDPALSLLREWLGLRARARPHAALTCLAAGALLLAVGPALFGPYGALPGTLLLGAGLGGLLLDGRVGRAVRRRSVEARFLRLEPGGIETWDAETVTRALSGLEARRDAILREAAREETRQLAREETEEARRLLRREQAWLDAFLAERGLDPKLSSSTLLQRVHRRLEGEARRLDLDALDAELAVHEASGRELGAEIGGFLGRLGLPAPVDAAAALAALDALRDRLRRVEDLEANLALRAEVQAERLATQTRFSGELDGLFTRLGLTPGEEPALRALLGQRPEFERLTATCEGARLELANARRALADTPTLLDLEIPEVQRRLQVCEIEARDFEERARNVSDLERDLAEATRGGRVEAARARLDEALAAFAQARERAAEDDVGRRLLDWLQERVSRDLAPPLLLRARASFLRFTRGAFGLDVEGERLVAWDQRLGVRRALAELSDATRVQLLLAARLAFLEQAEAGASPLPLFLDEVLATTDASRFREIGRCLLEQVTRGRQVFYASAHPDEVLAWRALCEAEGVALPYVAEIA